MKVAEFQKLIEEIYFEKDNKRGVDGTFRWFCEEIGELSRTIRKGSKNQLKEEFADVFAWLASLASICDINLSQAIKKYQQGCPKCHKKPCICREAVR